MKGQMEKCWHELTLISVRWRSGSIVKGKLICRRRGQSGRNLSVTIEYEVEPLEGSRQPRRSQTFTV